MIRSLSFSQHALGDTKDIDQDLLNKYILDEVNHLRKKVKADSLYNQPALYSAGKDHVEYMSKKQKLSHIHRFNKYKKTPKNRVDLYGGQFETVGENIQLNNLNIPVKGKKGNAGITTYEELAKSLVQIWKDSPGHYANMINESYLGTYTTVKIMDDGSVYACQLFCGSMYEYPEEIDTDTLPKYKPHNDRKCRHCDRKPPIGKIIVTADSSIYFVHDARPLFQRGVRRSLNSLFRDGLAADIVLKSQYPCDSANFFNGSRGIRGIPLEPVYMKSFWKGDNYFFLGAGIYLGKVPSWVHEDFEVNLTVVRRKRACVSIIQYVIPTWFDLHLDISLNTDTLSNVMYQYLENEVSYRINYNKANDIASDSLLAPIAELVKVRGDIDRISIRGYSSIEGTTELNQKLYTQRARNLIDKLWELGIDTSKIEIRTEENFRDFRRDIKGTDFAWLDTLTDDALKSRVQDKALSNALEGIFKNERYAEVIIHFSSSDSTVFTKEKTIEEINQLVSEESYGKIEKDLAILYGLGLKGELDVEDIRQLNIPLNKSTTRLKYQQALIEFLLDTANNIKIEKEKALLKSNQATIYKDDSLHLNRYDTLRNRITPILDFRPADKNVNTALAFIEYQHRYDFYRDFRKKYAEFMKLPYVDKRLHARMIIDIGVEYDWGFYYGKGVKHHKKYYRDMLKAYIKDAKLNVYETFEMASYYAFFEDYDMAYEMTRKVIDDTDRPENIVFFLKLIYLLKIDLPHKTVVKYFRKVRDLSGDQFCTYFNTPDLNFQILDDPDIMKIYCEQCSGK